MAITINTYDRYDIKGKIININNSTLTISVTSPFTYVIEFHCDSYQYDNILHPPSSKYNWLDLQNAHPGVMEASAYYNSKDKCFYTKEEGGESEWKSTDFEDIYNDNPSLVTRNPNTIQEQEKYRFFRDRYMAILQKGQLCHFSAYAMHRINTDWCSVQNPQVARYPGDYEWIYDPDTFRAEKWNTESIDDLVKEIRPSRECLNQLLESYEDDDWKAKKEKLKKIGRWFKSALKRTEDSIGKYPRLLWLILTLGMFLVGIGSLVVSLLKN